MKFREEINESLTLKFAAAARERKAQGLPIISLGLGEPDFSTPPEFIQAVSDVLARGNSRYSGATGVAPLREKITNKFQQDNQIPATVNNVVVFAGAKPALSVALMALLQPNDEVLVVSPSFVSFVPQLLLAEPSVTVVRVPLDPSTLSLSIDAIEAAITHRTRAVLINTPNNPAGSTISQPDLQKLYALACKHDFTIISDEVYEKLAYTPDAHFSVGSLESEVSRVITINAFSKSHALTGWRLGYACIPAELLSKVAKIQQHMNTNTCTFVQQAVAEAWDLSCPHLADYNESLQDRAEAVCRWVADEPALSCQMPKAGFFAFVSIANLGLTSNEFCAALLSHSGVATTPGLAFGPEWDDHFRISFAVPKRELHNGLAAISEFVASL